MDGIFHQSFRHAAHRRIFPRPQSASRRRHGETSAVCGPHRGDVAERAGIRHVPDEQFSDRDVLRRAHPHHATHDELEERTRRPRARDRRPGGFCGQRLHHVRVADARGDAARDCDRRGGTARKSRHGHAFQPDGHRPDDRADLQRPDRRDRPGHGHARRRHRHHRDHCRHFRKCRDPACPRPRLAHRREQCL